MVAPISQHVHDAHNAPTLQFAQAVADIRPGDGETVRNLFGVQRLGREKQKSMNLGDRPVDSPPRPHLSPVQNKSLVDRRKRHRQFLTSVLSDISVITEYTGIGGIIQVRFTLGWNWDFGGVRRRNPGRGWEQKLSQ